MSSQHPPDEKANLRFLVAFSVLSAIVWVFVMAGDFGWRAVGASLFLVLLISLAVAASMMLYEEKGKS